MAAVITTKTPFRDDISKLKASLETFKLNLNIEQQNLEKIEHSIQTLTQEIAQITAENDPERAGDLAAQIKLLKETYAQCKLLEKTHAQRTELKIKIKQLNEEIHATQLTLAKKQFETDIASLRDPGNAYRKKFEDSGKTVHEFLFETQGLRITHDNSNEEFLGIIDDYQRLDRHDVVTLWRKLDSPLEHENVFNTAFKIFNETQDPAYGLLLSMCYKRGFGTEQDKKKAFDLDQTLMDKGSVIAQCSVAYVYYTGKFLPENIKKCHELHVSATAPAQRDFYTPHFYWGQALLLGDMDVEKSVTAGLKLLHTAAINKHSLAATFLASYFMNCTVKEVPNRGKKAFFYAKLAADLGSPLGIMDLAWCYFKGLGTPVNYSQSHALMQRSAELGCSHALELLARNYANGIKGFLAADLKKYVTLFFQALRQEGSTVPTRLEDHKLLFIHYQNNIEFMEAAYASCYQCFQGHVLGNPQDSFIIGRFFQLGLLVPQDIEEAIACFKDALKFGHPDAANALASLLCASEGSSSEVAVLPSLSPSDIYQLEGLVDSFDVTKVIKQTKKALTPLWKTLCEQWKSSTGEGMPSTLCQLVVDYAYEAPKSEKPKASSI